MSMNTATILIGNAQNRLKDIPDQTVQACITSPPYWGLRDYGTATWNGGDPTCDHQSAKKKSRYDYPMPESAQALTHKTKKPGTDAPKWADTCPSCGATKQDSQLGLEPTPELYVENMVAVFREVWRVLKDDGVLWLNLGDSYWNNFGGGSETMTTGNATAVRQRGRHNKPKHDLFKIKDLVGIPWRVAFALQADGWYLRQDIIWHKPNPMPESVTDRCTKAHEYLFMLTKNQRYYFDHKAIKEDAKTPPVSRNKHGEGYQADYPKGDRFSAGERVWGADGKRNRRSVWSISTKPFKGAHFAVMPEALTEPPILAATKPTDTILDPFMGAGTVAVVALRHNRNFIGCELNPEYAAIAEKRISEDRPMMNTVKVNAA